LALGLTLAGYTAHAQGTPAPTTTTKDSKPAISDAKSEDEETAKLISSLEAASDAPLETASATTNDAGPSGIVPFTRGLNASIATTSQHDSADGWASLITPNIAFRFNRHFSVFAEIPVYSYINVYDIVSVTPPTKTAAAVDNYGFRRRNFLLGDTDIAGQFEAHFRAFDYNLTGTLGTPTGDDDNGLGAGQVTFNINNHFERGVGNRLTPELELGIGDSPNLVDTRVRKSYTDVGQNAHFQVGLQLQLPVSITFTAGAYEELPLSTQTITSTTTNGKKGTQLKIITTTTNRSVGEDNGFLNTLDIPLSGHVTLSGFYNRSLRNKIDTAGFSLTFLLKAPPHSNESVH
jgi:hypothetical protein